MSRSKYLALLLLLLALLLAACSSANDANTNNTNNTANEENTSEETSDEATEETKLVGISMPTKTSTRWISDGESMVASFEALGYDTDLQFADNDIPNQLAQIGRAHV